ncbi:MAG: NAD-dependent epimerase/dehydratase family protein [Methylophaga sp.]|nr:NAD-dependent epimerase/dehydratase family protein [Methylophaga sp.]
MKIVITGATGFIGRALVNSLVSSGFFVIAIVREYSPDLPDEVEQLVVGDLNTLLTSSQVNIKTALAGADVVIHLAARAHILKETADTPLTVFRQLNRDVTIKLARMSSELGVKRFIFLSSIGVNGVMSSNPFLEIDEPAPREPYAIAKFEAELELMALKGKMEWVIIRSPLVYGPNVPGNFSRLIKGINWYVPLPFSAIKNQRSFVALDNLVSLIVECMLHPKAVNEIFLISDDEDVSISELIYKIANAFDRKAFLFPLPAGFISFVASILGQKNAVERLVGTLQIDNTKVKTLLGWEPVITMDEQMKKMASAFKRK